MPQTASPESLIYRLTDIDTEEVSVVDRAANQRKFIVVKGDKMPKPGSPVVPDGKGGHTTDKATPPPEVGTPPTPAPAEPNMPSEPVLNLSPETKAELTKRLDNALNRITALKTLIGSATEVAGVVEVPSTIADLVAELLTGISHGDVEKGAVAKGLPQFSSARVTQIQTARDALDALLGSIKPVEAPTSETPPAPPPEVAPTTDEVVAKAVAKAMASFELKLAGGFDKIASVVATHGIAIAKQNEALVGIEKSGRATPRSSAPEGARETTNKADDEDVRWPSDMSNPDKHDLSKTNPEDRFTVPKR